MNSPTPPQCPKCGSELSARSQMCFTCAQAAVQHVRRITRRMAAGIGRQRAAGETSGLKSDFAAVRREWREAQQAARAPAAMAGPPEDPSPEPPAAPPLTGKGQAALDDLIRFYTDPRNFRKS